MEKEKCPYCKGSKFIYIGCEEMVHSGKRSMYPQAATCYCVLNKQVNIAFPIFSPLPDVSPQDIKRVYSLFPLIDESGKAGNFLFVGDEVQLLYIAKAFFVGGFSTKNYLIYEGRQIVEKYHVPKKDEWLTIEFLNNPDLLVILFTSHTDYNTLKSCVLDIVKNRIRLNRATWIYTKNEESLKKSSEYSNGLDEYLESYKTKSLSANFKFTGYNPVEVAMSKQKQKQQLNDSLGDF